MVVMAPLTPRAGSATSAWGRTMHSYTRLGMSWKNRQWQHSTNILANGSAAPSLRLLVSREAPRGMGAEGGTSPGATSAVGDEVSGERGESVGAGAEMGGGGSGRDADDVCMGGPDVLLARARGGGAGTGVPFVSLGEELLPTSTLVVDRLLGKLKIRCSVVLRPSFGFGFSSLESVVPESRATLLLSLGFDTGVASSGAGTRSALERETSMGSKYALCDSDAGSLPLLTTSGFRLRWATVSALP